MASRVAKALSGVEPKPWPKASLTERKKSTWRIPSALARWAASTLSTRAVTLTPLSAA